MNKKELVEKLRNEMPEFTGTEEEIELKTALYIYVEIAKMKSFDARYWWGKKAEIQRVKTKTWEDSQNVDNAAKRKILTCVSLSALYEQVLKDFGIRCSTIIDEGEQAEKAPEVIPHRNNIITTKSGKRYNVDIQKDMYRIQTGERLKYFAGASEYGIVITQDDLTKMLIEIGYISSEKDYREYDIEGLKSKIQGMDIDEAFRTVLEDDKIVEGSKNAGTTEASRYYYAIIGEVFSSRMLKEHGYEISKFQCRKKKAGTKDAFDYTFAISSRNAKTGEIELYIYSPKMRRMLPCSLEELDKLEKQGLILGKTEKEQGVGRIRKELNKRRKLAKSMQNSGETLQETEPSKGQELEMADVIDDVDYDER